MRDGLPSALPQISWPPKGERNGPVSQVKERPLAPPPMPMSPAASASIGPVLTSAGKAAPQYMAFQVGGQRVTFFPDGHVDYGGTPSEAAKVFWKAVEASWPANLKPRDTHTPAMSERERWIRLTWAKRREEGLSVLASHTAFHALLDASHRDIAPYSFDLTTSGALLVDDPMIVFHVETEGRRQRVCCEGVILEDLPPR